MKSNKDIREFIGGYSNLKNITDEEIKIFGFSIIALFYNNKNIDISYIYNEYKEIYNFKPNKRRTLENKILIFLFQLNKKLEENKILIFPLEKTKKIIQKMRKGKLIIKHLMYMKM